MVFEAGLHHSHIAIAIEERYSPDDAAGRRNQCEPHAEVRHPNDFTSGHGGTSRPRQLPPQRPSEIGKPHRELSMSLEGIRPPAPGIHGRRSTA